MMLAVQDFPYMLGAIGPILLGIAILIVLRITDNSTSLGGDLVHRLLVVGSWGLIAFGIVAVATIGLAFVWWPILVVVLLMILHRRRRSRQQALLAALAVASARMMPLVPMIEAYAEEGRGPMSHRAWRLAESLRRGNSLSQSLRHRRGLVSPEALLMIHIGDQAGALAPALQQVSDARDSQDALWSNVLGKIAYFCMLIVFAAGIASFIAIKVFPAFEKIFADYDAELPFLTQLVSGILAPGGVFFVWGAFLLFVLLIYIVLRYIGWIRFGLPGLNWLTRRLETARILDALALVVAANRPLPEAIATLAQWYPRWSIRRRLKKVSRDVQAGADCCASLAVHGLLSQADLAVLHSAERVGNLAWAMHEMADSNRRRVAYRANLLLQLLFPVVIIAFGTLVGVFFVAYFLPLCHLIESLA